MAQSKIQTGVPQGLLTELRRLARRYPQRYRWRVAMMGGLGYLYLGGTGIALGGISTFLVWVGLAHGLALAPIVLGTALGLVALKWLKSLCAFQNVVPQGIKLDATQAPELFELVERLRQRLNAPKIDGILLTPEMNAYIFQRPRVMFLGLYTNYLVLGSLLMQSLSSEEFQAVLGHELAHLSKRHHQFQAQWFYRQNLMWQQLRGDFYTPRYYHLLKTLVDPFWRWYAPMFRVYAATLSRQAEFEADRQAADLVGPNTTAQALLATEVMARYQTFLWEALRARAQVEPNIADDAQRHLWMAMKQSPGPTLMRRWVGDAIATPTDTQGTHPSLKARLAALGSVEQFTQHFLKRQPPTITAAEHLLGAKAL
jgi:Zn-dependent protease with chaperone function